MTNTTRNQGQWIGVVLDEPVGRNDGTIRCGGDSGVVKYMAGIPSGSNYGVFVRPNNVQVGDFPERDLLEEDDDDNDNDDIEDNCEDEL